MSLNIFTELEITQDLKVSNNLEISQNIDVSGNIILSGESSSINLRTIKSNYPTNVDPCGNYIDISGSALLVPRGPTASRMSIDGTLNVGVTAKPGMIMYDTDQKQFIGVINGAGDALVWTGLGGVISIDQKTKITATNQLQEDGLRFYTNDNFNMYINQSGQIFLGDIQESWASTTSPQLIYHKTSDPIFMIARNGDGNNGIKFHLYDDNNARIFNTYSSGKLSLGSGGQSERMIINTNGNVGIGTTTPYAKLTLGFNDTKTDNTTDLHLSNFMASRCYIGIGRQEYREGHKKLIGFGYVNASTSYYPAYLGYIETEESQETFGDLIFGTRPTSGGTTEPTERMRITAAGNVGIGTDSPGVKLDVLNSGTGVIAAFASDTAGDSGILVKSAVNSDSDGYIEIRGGNSGNSHAKHIFIGCAAHDSNHYNSDIVFKTRHNANTFAYSGTYGATERMRIQYDGNVGIGTDSPGEKLEVSGTVKATSFITSHINITSYKISQAGGILSLQDANDRDLVLCNNSTGGVAIGSDGPGGAKLQIKQVQSTAANTNPFLRLMPTTVTNTTGLTSIFLGVSTGNNYGISLSAWRKESNGYPYFAIKTHYNSGSGDTRFLLDRYGNVGIGTTSPTSKLHIICNSIFGNEGIKVMTSNGSSGTNIGYGGISSMDTNRLRLGANNTEYMSILNGGNVGIGTTGPGSNHTAKLEVNGNIKGAKIWTNKIQAYVEGNVAGGAHLYIGGNGGNGSWNNYVFFGSGNAYINSANGDIHTATGIFHNGDYDTNMKFDTNIIRFTTANVERLRIGSNGYVGIGTNSPGAKLDVNGSMRASYDSDTNSYFGRAAVGYAGRSDYAGFSHLHRSGTTNYSFMSSSTGDTFVNAAAGYGIYFRINDSNKMTMDTNGRLGIGTTSPTCSLDIRAPDNGTAKIMLCGSSQGTGDLFVGQSTTYGGGIMYNGDGSPSTGTTTDAISFYRKGGGGATEVFFYMYNSNTVNFKGDITSTGDITAYYSDERLKTFKGTISDPIGKIKKLNGYYFVENELAKSLGYDNDKLQVGVSAQEVEKVLPEIVTDAPIDKKYKTIWYEKLTPLLIEGIKAQQTQISSLQSQIDELKQLIQNKL